MNSRITNPDTKTAQVSESCSKPLARRRHRDMQGFSLIEVMVTISIGSLVLISVGVALTSLFRAESSLREQTLQSSIRSRFELEMRTDLHQAISVEPLPGTEAAQGFMLKGPNARRIEYRIQESQIQRTAFDQETLKHRDGFRLPRYTTATYRIAQENGQSILSLDFSRRPDSTHAPPSAAIEDRIVAAIGLDRQMTQ
jgi:prepilin-type N-terminal cleavage/methylation domain-containing protein